MTATKVNMPIVASPKEGPARENERERSVLCAVGALIAKITKKVV